MTTGMAWACRINRENQSAIASENPKFNKDEFENWLEIHGGGYFVRDESSQFDCKYMDELVFDTLYRFERGNEDVLFRRIEKI